MTIQYSEAPGGQHEQSSAGKEDLNQTDRESARGGIEAIGKEIDEVRRRLNSNEHDHRRHEHEQREDGIRNASSFFLVTAGEELCVDRDERSRERAFAKDVLQKVRNAKRGAERTRSVGRAEVMRKDSLPDYADNATDQNSHSDQQRGAAGASFSVR